MLRSPETGAGVMRWRVLGQGEEEAGWRDWLRACEHEELLDDRDGNASGLEAPLLDGTPEAVVVGGALESRNEPIRRGAELGVALIVLHPAGLDPDALYQVAVLPRDQAPALVPELPWLTDPGWVLVRERVERGEVGETVSIQFQAELGRRRPEVSAAAYAGGVGSALVPLLGSVEAVTATGTDEPIERRIVQLRGSNGGDAELRITRGLAATTEARLEVVGERGSVVWVGDAWLTSPATVRIQRGQQTEVIEIGEVDRRAALLASLKAQCQGQEGRPGLREAILAMEIGEAVERSRARGRTFELHQDEISELGSFKAVMTSLGCGVILMVLTLFVLAQIMRALEIPGSAIVAWSTLPLLAGYALLQLLRWAARPSRGRGD